MVLSFAIYTFNENHLCRARLRSPQCSSIFYNNVIIIITTNDTQLQLEAENQFVNMACVYISILPLSTRQR